MYVKVMADGPIDLFIPPKSADLKYGRFVTDRPLNEVVQDTPVGGVGYLTCLFDEAGDPDGFYDCVPNGSLAEPCPSEPWWVFKYAMWRDEETGHMRAVVASNDREMYIMGDNGKTIDKV